MPHAHDDTEEKRTEPLNLRLTPTKKRAFHAWCVMHKTDMTRELDFHIDRLISGKAKPAPPKVKTPRRK